MAALAPFSVSQFTTWHLSFEQDIQLYSRLKLDGIEICERKMSRDPTEARRQLSLVKDAGLHVTSVQPRCHAMFPDSMSPEPLDPEARMACYRKTIGLIAEAFPGQQIPLVTLTGIAPNRDLRAAYQTARRLYKDLARYAADRGVRIMLEPLHPMFMNTDTFICTLNDAERMLDLVNDKHFGIVIDTIHVFGEVDLPRRLASLGERIFAVHVSDWPGEHPRCAGDRLLPGTGCIDLPAILGGIEAAGYRGAYALEIFSSDELEDSLWKADPAELIDKARRGFQDAWNRRHTPGPLIHA